MRLPRTGARAVAQATGSQDRTLREELTRLVGEPLVREVLTTVETEVKYAGYLVQQERQIRRLEGRRTAAHSRLALSFPPCRGCRREIQEKLERVRPVTLGQAAQNSRGDARCDCRTRCILEPCRT